MITMMNSCSKIGGICAFLLLAVGHVLAGSVEQKGEKQDPQAHINALVRQLGDETYEQREQAVQALVKLAATEESAVLDVCLQVHDQNPDPEIRFRCMKILKEVVSGPIYNRPRGFLGVRLVAIPNLPEEINAQRLIFIHEVTRDTAAAEGGVEAGDIILAMNHLSMSSFNSVSRFIFHIQQYAPGTPIVLLVLRKGSLRMLVPILGKAGEDVQIRKFEPEEYFKIWLESTRDRLARSGRS
jgi:membrane-associated protease RseP (regulator of RpoE activity)